MRIILKDIPRLKVFKIEGQDELGEHEENYEKRRISIEEDSYLLSGEDEDITSIKNWKKHCCVITKDYVQTRSMIIGGLDWSVADSEDKDIAIEYFAYDESFSALINDTNKIIHLMGKGLTQQEAVVFLQNSYAKYHTKEKESYKLRNDSEKLTQTVITYLKIGDASSFVKTVKNLRGLYWQEGIVGTKHGLVGEGIMDYIFSEVGTDYELSGLEEEGFILNFGTWDDFKNALKDVFVNGNY